MVCFQKNGQAENELDKRKKEIEKEIRVLLLGTGESGKSTIFKQMKIIHLKGFQPQEMLSYKPTIWTNIIRCMRSLVQASKVLNISIQKEENKVFSKITINLIFRKKHKQLQILQMTNS
jgi:guanine nucleotide-binding protein G(i) subunit alpha